MALDWIEEVMRLPEDPGWQGPDTVYLLCHRYVISDLNATVSDSPMWLARVTPDPDWSIQRWRTGVCVNFREYKPHAYWDVTEISEPEASVFIEFDLIPVIHIDGREISAFD